MEVPCRFSPLVCQVSGKGLLSNLNQRDILPGKVENSKIWFDMSFESLSLCPYPCIYMFMFIYLFTVIFVFVVMYLCVSVCRSVVLEIGLVCSENCFKCDLTACTLSLRQGEKDA